jgi:aspartyl-tRNA(Asn)/glutamyl-tRNA(Gln) amidotransferase subunit C
MAMKPEDVRGVAELARLEVPDAELERTARELSAVLEFAATLRQLDLEGLEPTAFAPRAAPLRDDATDPRRLTVEQATAAAPETEGGFFIVPPIVENVQP